MSTASLTSQLRAPRSLDISEKDKIVGNPDDPDSLYDDKFLVQLEPHEHPQHLSNLRKWVTVFVISTAAACVTCASSVAAFAEDGVSQRFNVAKELSILSISLFIVGLGLGPLVIGPLSEIYGRNIVYRVSYSLFFLFTFPVAFAPNIAVHLIFRFVTGFCGSAFLSVAGGSVSDLFSDSAVANPMAWYTLSPFMGPVLGPLLSGFINQNLNWRWTYYINLIWIFVEVVALFLFVPETYVPILSKWKAERLRECSGNSRYWASLERDIEGTNFVPFYIDQLLPSLSTSLILGILYLAFQAFPFIFIETHGFDMQSTGLSFLGIGLGMILAISTQPYWNGVYRRAGEENKGRIPPETRLHMGEVGAILVPVGLFWLAFTTYRGVPWIIPILACVPFGSGMYFVFTSTFTYLVTAYRPIAASAMASNSAMRSIFAAAFPLFAGAMYRKLGTVGATALLAGIMTIMAPLPFVFRRIGARLRRTSRFADRS